MGRIPGGIHVGGIPQSAFSGSAFRGGVAMAGRAPNMPSTNRSFGTFNRSFNNFDRSLGSFSRSPSSLNRSFGGLTPPRSTLGSRTVINPFVGNRLAMRTPSTAWRHTQTWNGWNGNRAFAWDRDHDHDFDRHHNRFAFLPYYYPYYYPYAYDYYDYGLYGWPYYYYDYSYYPGYYGSGYDTYTSAPYAQASSYSTPQVTTVASPTGEQYLNDARAAFAKGDYRESLRLAGHAAVELPRDPAVHELLSLALFAQKDYRGAAMESHAALSLAPPIDWATLYQYYGNEETYAGQLRALENFVQENPKEAEGHFLLAYHYIMTDHKDAAKRELAAAVAITPADQLAERLIKQLSP
ncbi:MAG: tetratricopeptide repeat protein [Pirellulales bacterium]